MNQKPVSAPQQRPRYRRGSRRHVAAIMLGALLLGGVAVAAPPAPPLTSGAHAIENHHGPGVNWGNGIHVNGAGAFIIDGRYVYCAEPWVRSGPEIPDFVGSATIPGNSSAGVSVAATEGAALQEVTFVVERYGQTNDNLQAAAVALAVWEIRGADGRGNAGYEAQLAAIRASVGPDVVAFSHQLMSEASSWVSARLADESGTGAPTISVTPQSAYSGLVSVPTGALSLRLENGVFSDGTTSRTWSGNGAPTGTSLSWHGQPPSEGWDRYYRVSFSGEYLAVPTTVLWGDGGNSQSSIYVETSEVKPFEVAFADVDTTWAPEVSTLVSSKFVSVGGQHSDDMTFSAAPAGLTASGEWRWRLAAGGGREWMPVKANVTAYGPFLSDPALNPSFEAPAGAPVAARASFTTDPTRDHSTPQTYSFLFDDEIIEQGYYTYKWDIVGSDQDPSIVGADDCISPNAELGCRVLPRNYFFSDGFGTTGETQVGKMNQGFTTKLSTHEVALNESFTDDLTIPAMHNWLRDDDGARIPLTLTGTAYLVEGSQLAQSVEVPENAVPLATTRVTTDPQVNEQVLTSEPITIPVATNRAHQHVTMRWCIVDEDQLPRAQGFWEERCDDFGIPNESARIAHPEVRTEAQPQATVGDTISDVAIVDGPVPEGTELVFEVFKAPVAGDLKQDENGDVTDVAWTPDELESLGDDAVCTFENRSGRTDAVVVQAGPNDGERYVSPGIQIDKAGTYWWVESLTHRDSDSDTETLLVSGTCGLQNETTLVEEPQPPVPPTPDHPKLAVTGTPHGGTHGPALVGGLIAGGVMLAGGIAMLIGRRARSSRGE